MQHVSNAALILFRGTPSSIVPILCQGTETKGTALKAKKLSRILWQLRRADQSDDSEPVLRLCENGSAFCKLSAAEKKISFRQSSGGSSVLSREDSGGGTTMSNGVAQGLNVSTLLLQKFSGGRPRVRALAFHSLDGSRVCFVFNMSFKLVA